MKNLLQCAFLTLALLVAASTVATAQASGPLRQSAPEVDPSLAVVGISLLAGTLTVARARRRK
jgi:hypothetical protein